ncbi:3-oxoadipate enol-lactonase [Gordonia lacunae]|uniref:3-oxoadipate enol-lactonase n=1 Tax=Gordonia lacunae TaxID=417102 RepID=UPI0039E4B3AE
MSVQVHAVVTGRPDGPAVVLSNSLGSTHRMWDAQIDAFEERFRVVRYDTRGHGDSAVAQGPYTIDELADDVIALLDRLDIERAHLVGLSLGGMTVMRVAARNPERVERLALLCTAAYLPPAQGWTDRAALVRADGTSAVATAVVQRWFTPGYLAANSEARQGYEAMVADTHAEGYAACCEAIAAMDQRPDLSSITAPTLAIAGADDPATPPDLLRDIVDAVPHGRLLVVPDSAHLANAEQADTITPALIEHLEQQ